MSEKDRLNLLSLLEAIDNIESYTVKLNDADEFAIDKKSFDACLMNFIYLKSDLQTILNRF